MEVIPVAVGEKTAVAVMIKEIGNITAFFGTDHRHIQSFPLDSKIFTLCKG